MATVSVTEGLDRFGGYILKAGGRVFHTMDEVVKAFPGGDLTFVPKPPPRNTSTVARDVDFPLFDNGD
ncbi:MAG: hypothetical protein WA459_18025 [Stellaceae bacterium]